MKNGDNHTPFTALGGVNTGRPELNLANPIRRASEELAGPSFREYIYIYIYTEKKFREHDSRELN